MSDEETVVMAALAVQAVLATQHCAHDVDEEPLMHTATIRPDGTLDLGPDAERLGFRPGTVVQIAQMSTGNLLLEIDTALPLDVSFRPLVGGAAQLAIRHKRQGRGI